MSVATEITRIQNERNALRAKLTSLGLATSTDNLENCVKAVDGIIGRGAENGTISAKAEEYVIAAGYHNGNGKVSILASEQDKIVPENIKSGITILGVSGSYAGAGVSLQEKTITPTETAQTVTPDSGYDGLSAVNVGAIPGNYADVQDVTATATDVLAGKIIVTAEGTETAGTMVNNGAVNATINGMDIISYTIPQGYHSGSGTISLDNTIETALAAI